MKDITLNELEAASKTAVMQAANHFAQALADTPEFQEFEQAYYRYRQDETAQQAVREFQQKQQSLKAMIMLNAISDEERQELKKLQERIYLQGSVIQYTKAQETLIALSQEAGDLISSIIGMDYGNTCRTGGCCG